MTKLGHAEKAKHQMPGFRALEQHLIQSLTGLFLLRPQQTQEFCCQIIGHVHTARVWQIRVQARAAVTCEKRGFLVALGMCLLLYGAFAHTCLLADRHAAVYRLLANEVVAACFHDKQ